MRLRVTTMCPLDEGIYERAMEKALHKKSKTLKGKTGKQRSK